MVGEILLHPYQSICLGMAYVIRHVRTRPRGILSLSSVFLVVAMVFIFVWISRVTWIPQKTLRIDARKLQLSRKDPKAANGVNGDIIPLQTDRIPAADQESELKYQSAEGQNKNSLGTTDSLVQIETKEGKPYMSDNMNQSKTDLHVSSSSLSVKEDDTDLSTVRTSSLFVPPSNENPIRRFPQSVIIGFGKCGTRALLHFLGAHPYVVCQTKEVHFYDSEPNFSQGYGWYLGKMPLSYSNQVTMEKTPCYITTPRARDEMLKVNPKVKLIVLMRDPVDRLVSQFLQKHRFDSVISDPVSSVYMSKNKFDPEMKDVQHGIYHQYIAYWLQKFPGKQFIFINDDELTQDPLTTLKRVETFLEIPSMYSKSNFVRNETSGFYCFKGFEPSAEPKCLTKMKGFKHPPLPKRDEIMLYNFYRPHNEKLFRIIGQRFDWEQKN